jgi:hypothetical protein
MYNTGKEGIGELYPWLKQVPDPELLNTVCSEIQIHRPGFGSVLTLKRHNSRKKNKKCAIKQEQHIQIVSHLTPPPPFR